MTDLLGPASAPNAVTARLVEYRSFGAVDTWFKPCSNPASQDGTQVQAAWLNGIMAQLRGAIRGNGQLVNGTGPVVPEVNTVDALLLGAIQLLIARGQPNAGADTGTADALAVAPSTPWPEYVRGARIWVVKSSAAGPNATAAPSIAVSGLAAVTIVRRDGSALLPGDLPAGVAFCAEHDGTYFRLVSLTWGEIAAAVQSGKWVYGRDTGAANAAVVTLFPVQAPVDGQEILVRLAYANTTTTPTVNVSGFGTKAIMRQGGGAPAVGDLQPGYLPLVWDASNGFWRVNGLVASDILALIAAFQIGPASVQIFSTAGTFTYTPTTGTRTIEVTVIGGGAGGGGSVSTTSSTYAVGVSGSAGGFAQKFIYSGFAGATIVVGAGGAAGPIGGAGGNGGTSSFNCSTATLTCGGGQGGGAGFQINNTSPFTSAALTGGSASGGDVNAAGGASQSSLGLTGGALQTGRAGESFIGKSDINYGTTRAGSAGTGSGAGGTAGTSYSSDGAGQAGGPGRAGTVIVKEYK